MTGEEFEREPSPRDIDATFCPEPDSNDHPFGIIAVWAVLALTIGMFIGAVILSVRG